MEWHGGLILSSLDFGWSGLGSMHCVLRHLTLTVLLSTQVYKWVDENLMLGVTVQQTYIPSKEE